MHVTDPEALLTRGRTPGLPFRRGAWGRRTPRLVVLAVASVALVAAGAVLVALASGMSGSPARQNVALSDQTTTRVVVSTISADVAALFSYSYSDLGAPRAEAARVLTGQALTQYNQLSALLPSAASERLTLSTRVVQAGVSWLSGGTARLLLFLDQTATKAGGKATTAAAQLAVTAQLTSGQWRITSIEAR